VTLSLPPYPISMSSQSNYIFEWSLKNVNA
jgi:hypothetical protein